MSNEKWITAANENPDQWGYTIQRVGQKRGIRFGLLMAVKYSHGGKMANGRLNG